MVKNAFVRTVGPSTISQGTLEDSPTYAPGNRLWSWLWTLCWPMNWLQPLSAVIQMPLENTVLDNHPQMREPCGSSHSHQKSYSTLLEQNNVSLDALETVKGQFDFTISLLSQRGTVAQCQEYLSFPTVGERVCELSA